MDIILLFGSIAAVVMFSSLVDDTTTQFYSFLYSIGFMISLSIAVSVVLSMAKDFFDGFGGPDDLTPV